MPERLPFDPSRTRSARRRAEGPSVLSVRQVNELVRGALARELSPTLHVLGEIGNLARPGSGHVYFTLKDADSELRCVMWRSAAGRLKFEPEVGMEVIASGGIDVYAARGTYQLVARKLEPRGVGALEIAFRQLKERLEGEGLFDAGRKRPLPAIPERVAVVTSASGAAIRDILHTLGRRFPALEVLVYPVRVQGEGAAAEISAAIGVLNQHSATLGGIDVLIVGRGGGSLEDLWAFNEEVMARAIAASRIPVVSAVGHEVDVSISDLVADLRAPTPTAAAELVTPVLEDLSGRLVRQTERAGRAAGHSLELSRARMETVLACGCLSRPLAGLREREQSLDEAGHRLRVAISELWRRAQERLRAFEMTVLRRGIGANSGRARSAWERNMRRLARAASRRVLTGEQRLSGCLVRVEKSAPMAETRRLADRVRQALARVEVAARTQLAHRRQVLEGRIQAVAAVDPRLLLKRGYSITRDARSRRVIRVIEEIRDHQRLAIEVSDGEFNADAQDPRQPGLFD